MEPTSSTLIQDLPPELQLLIFDYLDFNSRLNCTLVCRNWNRLAMSGAFLNERVLMKLEVDCKCNQGHGQPTRIKTVRYIGSVLCNSDRRYRALTILYMHETLPGINSLLGILRKFEDLTYLHYEQRHRVTHITLVEQIVQYCPRLKNLHLFLILARCNKRRTWDQLPNNLEEVTFSGVCLGDFSTLVQLFRNVTNVALRCARVRSDHLEVLVKFMPRVQVLKFEYIEVTGIRPLRLLKNLRWLRSLTIAHSLFAKEFSKWPKLPPSVRSVTLYQCAQVRLREQLHERWGHVEKFRIVEPSERCSQLVRLRNAVCRDVVRLVGGLRPVDL
ncbi:hypothetical protein quinque_012052 [Culex quinquefasciatus]